MSSQYRLGSLHRGLRPSLLSTPFPRPVNTRKWMYAWLWEKWRIGKSDKAIGNPMALYRPQPHPKFEGAWICQGKSLHRERYRHPWPTLRAPALSCRLEGCDGGGGHSHRLVNVIDINLNDTGWLTTYVYRFCGPCQGRGKRMCYRAMQQPMKFYLTPVISDHRNDFPQTLEICVPGSLR